MPFFILCLWGLLSGEEVTTTTRLPAKSRAPQHRLTGKLRREASKWPVKPLLRVSVYFAIHGGSGVPSSHPSWGPRSGTWATGSARTFLVDHANRQGPSDSRQRRGAPRRHAASRGDVCGSGPGILGALVRFPVTSAQAPGFCRMNRQPRGAGKHRQQRLLPAHTLSDSEEDSLWGFTSWSSYRSCHLPWQDLPSSLRVKPGLHVQE